MRRRMGLHAYQTRRERLEEPQDSGRRSLRRSTSVTIPSTPLTWKTCLTISNPTVIIRPVGASSQVALQRRRCGTDMPGVGTIHSIRRNVTALLFHVRKTTCSMALAISRLAAGV
jgi:hypothetical protein